MVRTDQAMHVTGVSGGGVMGHRALSVGCDYSTGGTPRVGRSGGGIVGRAELSWGKPALCPIRWGWPSVSDGRDSVFALLGLLGPTCEGCPTHSPPGRTVWRIRTHWWGSHRCLCCSGVPTHLTPVGLRHPPWCRWGRGSASCCCWCLSKHTLSFLSSGWDTLSRGAVASVPYLH